MNIKGHNKEIAEVKKNIAKRLRWSNKELWASLSTEDHSAVVEKYYHLSDIENIGILQVLQENRQVASNISSIILGALLGLSGSLAAGVVAKYLPEGVLSDLLFVALFFFLVGYLTYWIDRSNADRLREDRILEWLVEALKKESTQEEAPVLK